MAIGGCVARQPGSGDGSGNRLFPAILVPCIAIGAREQRRARKLVLGLIGKQLFLCGLSPINAASGECVEVIMKETETKHIVAFRSANLRPGETIQFFLEGWIGEMMGKGDKKQHNGMFILTNNRACFYRKGMFGEVLETIPIQKITSVETLSMMGYRLLRLHTSHDELAFKTFEEKALFDKVYLRLEELRHSDGQPKPASTAAPSDNPIEQLKKLAELRDTGILTDEEFALKKGELLSRM